MNLVRVQGCFAVPSFQDCSKDHVCHILLLRHIIKEIKISINTYIRVAQWKNEIQIVVSVMVAISIDDSWSWFHLK